MATVTIPDAELEAQVAAWVSTHGPVQHRLQDFERRQHGRFVLTFYDRLRIQFRDCHALPRRQGLGTGDWEVVEDPHQRGAPVPDVSATIARGEASLLDDHAQRRRRQRQGLE